VAAVGLLEVADDLGQGQFALDIDGRRSSYRLIVKFRDEDLEKVFPNPVEIEILKIEEVSNHYE